MNRWRTVLGSVLAVLAGLLAPLSVVTGWAHTLVSDTGAFVANYAPVVQSESVQQVLGTRLSEAIIDQLGAADNRLTRAAVGRVVDQAVGSDLFADATTTSLRLAHAELVALLTGEPGRLQVDDGEVQLRLAPFADAVKQRLSEAGVPFVDRLPEVTGGIPLLRIDPRLVPLLQSGYRVLDAVATWLPWLALALMVVAVWLWPNRRRALIGLGLSLLGGTLLVALAWRLALQGLNHRLGDDLAQVAGLVAQVTSAPVASPLLALGVTGAVVATLARLGAREPVAEPSRQLLDSGGYEASAAPSRQVMPDGGR